MELVNNGLLSNGQRMPREKFLVNKIEYTGDIQQDWRIYLEHGLGDRTSIAAMLPMDELKVQVKFVSTEIETE